ncbi:MAG: hypothetical protein WCP62_10635 [Planctomycetota bacterium]|jgi:hypothetical protein
MLRTSLLLSVLSAMLSVESSCKSMERTAQNKTQESSLVIATELTDEKQVEAEARQTVGHSLVDG